MTGNRTTELRVKRLRELLDKRGIEHYDHENGEPLRVLEKAEEPATSWRVDGASYCAVPDGKGTFDVWIDHCTPEQAIAATLRNTTCEYIIEDNMNESEGMGDVWFRCTNCDMCYDIVDDWLLKMPHCPKCGATVKGVR